MKACACRDFWNAVLQNQDEVRDIHRRPKHAVGLKTGNRALGAARAVAQEALSGSSRGLDTRRPTPGSKSAANALTVRSGDVGRKKTTGHCRRGFCPFTFSFTRCLACLQALSGRCGGTRRGPAGITPVAGAPGPYPAWRPASQSRNAPSGDSTRAHPVCRRTRRSG